jgi:hypothetical protein
MFGALGITVSLREKLLFKRLPRVSGSGRTVFGVRPRYFGAKYATH